MFDLNAVRALLRPLGGDEFIAQHQDAIAKVADGLDTLSDLLGDFAGGLQDVAATLHEAGKEDEPGREQMLDDLTGYFKKKYGSACGWSNPDITKHMDDDAVRRTWERITKTG